MSSRPAAVRSRCFSGWILSHCPSGRTAKDLERPRPSTSQSSARGVRQNHLQGPRPQGPCMGICARSAFFQHTLNVLPTCRIGIPASHGMLYFCSSGSRSLVQLERRRTSLCDSRTPFSITRRYCAAVGISRKLSRDIMTYDKISRYSSITRALSEPLLLISLRWQSGLSHCRTRCAISATGELESFNGSKASATA